MAAADPIKIYDARWEVHEFGDDEVRRLFEASLLYGQELGVDTITFTRDARLGAARVMELGVDVAIRMGLRVFMQAQPVSTPQGYYTALHVTQQHPRTMGLAITASHNPAQYIGVKFTVPTVAAIGYDCGPLGGLTKIRDIYHGTQRAEQRAGGALTLLDLTHDYIDYSLQAAGVSPGSLTGLSVVLDTFHGSAGPELYMALSKAGVRIEPLRLIPNGEFPTGSPNPTSQGKMSDAVELAGQRNCDAVIGIDGDGDRIVFGDRRGILTAGFAFVPILKACLERQGAGAASGVPALYDPKVSPLALAEWGKLGARPVLFRNGHSQIKDYMTQIGALAAAEESGHYYHRITLGQSTISGENSALTILLFLNALKHYPGLLDHLWSMEQQIFTTGEFNYQFDSDATRDAALDAVVRHFVGGGASTVTSTPDGIDLQGICLARGVTLEPGNVSLAVGWYSGYLRAATNEKGVVRSYFSAGDIKNGRRIEGEARQILETEFRGIIID